MNIRVVNLLTTALLLIGSRAVVAQTITVTPTVGPIVIMTAVAGSPPTAVTVGGGTYTVVTKKNTFSKITARLLTATPAGTTLYITLAAPPGGASFGAVALTTVAQNVVSLPNVNGTFSNLAITYQLSSTVGAGVVASSTRSVVLAFAP